MSTVGIKQLKNRLTQYLRRTKNGEEVVVTERGKPIALIKPIQSVERTASLEARPASLATEGFVTLPTQKPLKKLRLIKISGPAISKAILEDRR